ncbi:hypothetical protein ACFL0J_08850 [Candidatus Neomarinimicrobiota bacterium]
MVRHITSLWYRRNECHIQITDPIIIERLKKYIGWEYVVINGIKPIYLFRKIGITDFSAIKILQRISGTNEIEVCPDTGELYVTTELGTNDE